MEPREAKAVIEALATALVSAQDEAKELQKDLDATRDSYFAECGRSAELIAERDEARKLLAQSEGHNLLLQDAVNQLRAVLGRNVRRIAPTRLMHPDIEAEIRAEMRADQAEPGLAAMMGDVPPAHLNEAREAATDAAQSIEMARER